MHQMKAHYMRFCLPWSAIAWDKVLVEVKHFEAMRIYRMFAFAFHSLLSPQPYKPQCRVMHQTKALVMRLSKKKRSNEKDKVMAEIWSLKVGDNVAPFCKRQNSTKNAL